MKAALETVAGPEGAGERMRGEEIAVLEVLPQHVEALVPPQALQLRGVRAGLHLGRERAALQAVPAEVALREPGEAARA